MVSSIQEVSTAFAELGHNQAAVSRLDRVWDNLAFVEEVVSRVDVVLAGEQFGDHLARLFSSAASAYAMMRFLLRAQLPSLIPSNCVRAQLAKRGLVN